MPGNCGTEARSFLNSTDWFWEESYFSVAAASTKQTERVVKTRTCLCLSCDAFACNERPGRRVDTSRPESVCHRPRSRKWRENKHSITFRSLLRFGEGQERQDNLGKFTPRCKQFPSCLTSAAKTTLLTRHRKQFFVFKPVQN